MYKPWWEILEVESNASEEDIKESYARLIKENHSEDNPEKFMEIKDAYRTSMKIRRSQNQNRVTPKVEEDLYEDFKKKRITEQDREYYRHYQEIIIEEKTEEVNTDDFLNMYGDKNSKRYKDDTLSESINYLFEEIVTGFNEDDYQKEYKWLLMLEYVYQYAHILSDERLNLFYNKIKTIDYKNINYALRIEAIAPRLQEVIDKTDINDADLLILQSVLTQIRSPKQSFKAMKSLTDFKLKTDIRQFALNNKKAFTIIELLSYGIIIFAIIKLFVR